MFYAWCVSLLVYLGAFCFVIAVAVLALCGIVIFVPCGSCLLRFLMLLLFLVARWVLSPRTLLPSRCLIGRCYIFRNVFTCVIVNSCLVPACFLWPNESPGARNVFCPICSFFKWESFHYVCINPRCFAVFSYEFRCRFFVALCRRVITRINLFYSFVFFHLSVPTLCCLFDNETL